MSKQKNNIPVGLRLDSTNEGMMTSRRKALAMLPILRERDKNKVPVRIDFQTIKLVSETDEDNED